MTCADYAALLKTLCISYDLGFDGAPVFYSWPSLGTLSGYPVDESNIEWSQPNLERFLEDFTTQTDAENIYLIAHSMGNRALTRAVAALAARKPGITRKFRELILTAPDIDVDIFKRDIASQIITTNSLVTLYASSSDRALYASKDYHEYARLGEAGSSIVVVPGMETVDATTVDTSLLGHSYFAESRSVISDIYYLIREGKSADQRFGLRPKKIPSGKYWEFKP